MSLGLTAGIASAQTTPVSYDTMDVARLLRHDARMVVLGDSFASPTWSAVFPAFLMTYDKGPVTAIQTGTGPDNKIASMESTATSYLEINASTPSGYQVFTKEPVIKFFGLPLRGILQYHNSGQFEIGPQGGILKAGIDYDRLSRIPSGAPWSVGDDVAYRSLYLAPRLYGRLHQSLGLRAPGALSPLEFNPYTDARALLSLGAQPWLETPTIVHAGQINAVYKDLVMTVGPDNLDASVELYSTTQDLDPNTYAMPAGGVHYRINPATGERAKGLYYSYLADNSWSYVGFGSDRESFGTLDKTFSRAQMRHWLDVTTLDQNQPVVFVYYLATEVSAGKPTTKQRVLDMTLQAESVAYEIGLPIVEHLLVVPHAHNVVGIDQELLDQRFNELNDSMFELAEEVENIAVVSLYEATDRVLLNGSNAAIEWVSANIPIPYTYSDRAVDFLSPQNNADLLDLYQVHPANEDAAAYFGELLTDILFRANELDFNSDFVLDTADITAFVQLFIAGDPSVDMNGDGVIDGSDINTFVERFIEQTAG